MAELTTAVNELLKGKRVEENLRLYIDGLSSLYKRMAYLRMSMNFYTLAEVCQETDPAGQEMTDGLIGKICALVRQSVLAPEGSGAADLEKNAADLRAELVNRMEILTAYADRFQVYEYMLNRVEFRFREPEYSDSYYNGGFENDIRKYVTNDTDNTVVNLKIAAVVSQLPMRLSQHKFFDILNNTFTLYKTSDRRAVDDFVYMLRTAGLLYRPEGFDTEFPEFWELDRTFGGTDFAAVTEEEYRSLRDRLDRAAELANAYSDACVMLTEVVNDLYSIALTTDALIDVKEQEKLVSVAGEAYDAIRENRAPSTEAYAVFDEITGLQEKTSRLIDTPEMMLDEIKSVNAAEIGRLGMADGLDRIAKLARLQSASTFARLEDDPEAREYGGEQYAADAARRLTEEFTALFADGGRMFRRAVMASVIGNLPVFFNSIKEFAGYVRVALEQCGDRAERQACMSLINMMIVGE